MKWIFSQSGAGPLYTAFLQEAKNDLVSNFIAKYKLKDIHFLEEKNNLVLYIESLHLIYSSNELHSSNEDNTNDLFNVEDLLMFSNKAFINNNSYDIINSNTDEINEINISNNKIVKDMLVTVKYIEFLS